MNEGWLVTWLVSWMPQGLFGIADQAMKWEMVSMFLLGNRALIVNQWTIINLRSLFCHLPLAFGSIPVISVTKVSTDPAFSVNIEFFFNDSPRLVFRIQMNSLSHLLTYTYRLMATRFTAVGSSMSLRLWSSRTRSRVFCLSPTATRGGGLTPSIARLVFFHSLSPRRRPNPSSWISKTFQTWPMLTSTRRTPIYRWDKHITVFVGHTEFELLRQSSRYW